MTAASLRIALGQHSEPGRKPLNQDFHGACLPAEPLLGSKGIAVAIADGISSSSVSQIASEAAVAGFLADYFSTPETWSVKQSVQRVLTATNSWLHAQTRHSQYRFDRDRGYVCTFSALVLKAATAHLFHVGDARIYRWRDGQLEQLTEDHRLSVSAEQSYLSRALGIHPHLDIDYRALPLEPGDLFLLATDGVHEHLDAALLGTVLGDCADDLDAAARQLAAKALERGSDDNLTVQLVRIEALPGDEADDLQHRASELPCPPPLAPRMRLDGYQILRELHVSSRSHVYLARDDDSGQAVVLKTPSLDQRHDVRYLERFLTEDWIARRIDSPHVVRACPATRRRTSLYSVSEFVDGQTLAQWMIDHPQPDLESVRQIVEQIAKGLRAFHRLEMLHQDLRPANVMIDASGTVKLIDFGSTQVAGLLDIAAPSREALPGTAQYMAPEYFVGEPGTSRSDLYSLGVIAYQLLSGELPYGAEMAKTRRRAEQQRLVYRSLRESRRDMPIWVDEALRKAVHPQPAQRYGELSEFIFDLRQPNRTFLQRSRPPLLERNPVAFWRSLALLLGVAVVVLLGR